MFPYSFKDMSAVFSHPLAGDFVIAGKVGAGSLSVSNTTERTSQLVAADGAVMVSYISGDNGQLTVETLETSDLHKYFLNWFNAAKTQADAGDSSEWATMAVTIRLIVDGTGHVCTGVSPAKIPDKPYASQGQNVTWTLPCADIQHLTA